jgi:molybdate transport system substrate-binding protein
VTAVRHLFALCLLWPTLATAGEALVAVATNFIYTAGELEQRFEQASAHRITITSGATGKLYAQIRNGAPYDLLLAADQERPALLEQAGWAVAGSRFTYAEGRLVVWSRDPSLIRASVADTLLQPDIRTIAVASPRLAPYGAAALQVLQAVAADDSVTAQQVSGENVGQAFALVATGNADIGLVALAQVLTPRQGARGAWLEVDPGLYAPIRQDAVLLRHGADNPAARAFHDWLRGPAARELIATHGYGSP